MRDFAAKCNQIADQIKNTYLYYCVPRIRDIVYDSPLGRYIRTLLNTITEACLLLAAVYILCIIMLNIAYIMWELYQQTIVGQNFLVIFHEKAFAINEIMALNFWYFAIDITVFAFIICIGTSAIGWFLHISRYFYLSMGFFSRIAFWGLPISALVAFGLYTKFGFSGLEMVFLVVLIPTMCLFMNCFNYTEKLVPELGDTITEITRLTKKFHAYLISQLNELK